jgi:hypothetical protein
MPRPLLLRKDGVDLPFQLVKLDRSKLYGTVEVEALDGQGRRCELATLATDGKTLLGRGDVASGFLSAEGSWLERAGLRPVGPEGEPIAPVPSSFAAPIDLVDEAGVEEYLAHNVKSVYHLTCEADVGPLLAELGAGKIYRFPFSFRGGGLVADVGFLIANPDGDVFLAVGQPTMIHFIGLEPVPVGETEVEEAEADEAEADLDFGMM